MAKNTSPPIATQPKRRWRVSNDEWNDILNVRHGLWRCGYIVIPSDETGKKPLFSKWPQFQYDPQDPEPAIPRQMTNAGTLSKLPHLGTGASTTGLVTFDLDLDDADAVADARASIEDIAGPAPLVRFRDNSPRLMLIYGAGKTTPKLANDGFVKTPFGAIGCDAAHAGQFVHLHGLHPSGARLQYEDATPWQTPTHSLTKVEGEALPQIAKALAHSLGGDVGGMAVAGKGFAGDMRTKRGEVGLRDAVADLVTGASITNSMETIAEILINDLDVADHAAEELIEGLIMAGERMTPTEAKRYDNARSQLGTDGRQGIGICRAIGMYKDKRIEDDLRPVKIEEQGQMEILATAFKRADPEVRKVFYEKLKQIAPKA
ncbi:hypothetical protein PH7735_00352 [Shimia thalassica]|uniref:Uncharacterized protein n=1 Tax=Shimia thalassica TaxID=1715693 RepID=A0A0P1I168_9RHOB|nr:hypothetical protein [Shimia thalassica]CUJ84221.1 hypothetical protein PH7735_00352 [Shimia thalassica]